LHARKKGGGQNGGGQNGGYLRTVHVS
jgi:hypothetical protein